MNYEEKIASHKQVILICQDLLRDPNVGMDIRIKIKEILIINLESFSNEINKEK